jgi:hypothetical protein
VEYNFTGINQCQVRESIGLTFGSVLRAMLRQAPNIILIGEIAEVRAIPLIEPTAVHTIGLIAPERDPLPPAVRELLQLVQSQGLASLLETAVQP